MNMDGWRRTSGRFNLHDSTHCRDRVAVVNKFELLLINIHTHLSYLSRNRIEESVIDNELNATLQLRRACSSDILPKSAPTGGNLNFADNSRLLAQSGRSNSTGHTSADKKCETYRTRTFLTRKVSIYYGIRGKSDRYYINMEEMAVSEYLLGGVAINIPLHVAGSLKEVSACMQFWSAFLRSY